MYLLLFVIGVVMMLWDKLIVVFMFVNVVMIVLIVVMLMGIGFVVGCLLKMYFIDIVIVNVCYSG